MKHICLDKTINLSKSVMEGSVEVPDCIQVNDFCGQKISYSFNGSNVALPIEHIGLSMFAYQGTKNCFTVTQINKDGQVEQKYEEVAKEGAGRLSDFMEDVNPNTLNWYKDNEKEDLKLMYVGSKVLRPEMHINNMCSAEKPTGNPREMALREGFIAGLKEYATEVIGKNENETGVSLTTELADLFSQEKAIFNSRMLSLKEEADSLVVSRDFKVLNGNDFETDSEACVAGMEQA